MQEKNGNALYIRQIHGDRILENTHRQVGQAQQRVAGPEEPQPRAVQRGLGVRGEAQVERREHVPGARILVRPHYREHRTSGREKMPQAGGE